MADRWVEASHSPEAAAAVVGCGTAASCRALMTDDGVGCRSNFQPSLAFVVWLITSGGEEPGSIVGSSVCRSRWWGVGMCSTGDLLIDVGKAREGSSSTADSANSDYNVGDGDWRTEWSSLRRMGRSGTSHDGI